MFTTRLGRSPGVLHFLLLLLTPAVSGYIEYHGSDFRTWCSVFEPTKYVANAAVTVHEFVTAGTTLLFPDNDPSCARPNQTVTVDVCRIALNISTSSRSGIIFEGWFPETWTGRFLATGNGGIDGCVKYEDVDYGAANGFATVGSNNGHNGTGGSSFLHNDDVIKDYAWRSLHTITEVGKNLTNALYSSPLTHSYYLGCSGGGRQGIKAAEMFPGDFDGIVAGAPAVNFNNLTSWRASFFGKTGPLNSPNFISADVWSGLIHSEVLRQCDAIDGVEDGIIENPTLCDFRPEALICTRDATEGCLSTAQVEIVRDIFSPLYGSSGELVYPAMQPGSEVMAVQKLYAGSPFKYSVDWFRYVVYNNVSFDNKQFGVADITPAQALNPFNVQTYPSDLSDFAVSRKGKLIMFHGQQDNQITSFSSERFYNHLARGMSLPAPQIDDFLRYFRISGMFHCNAGPGPWMIGQASIGSDGFDPSSNVLAAMVRWVEQGIAPDTIEGTKFVDDVKEKGAERRRKHCRYPYTNTYIGGNASIPESWKCVQQVSRDHASRVGEMNMPKVLP